MLLSHLVGNIHRFKRPAEQAVTKQLPPGMNEILVTPSYESGLPDPCFWLLTNLPVWNNTAADEYK